MTKYDCLALAKNNNLKIVEDDKGVSIETFSGKDLIYRIHKHNYKTDPNLIWDAVYDRLKILEEKFARIIYDD